MRFSSWPASTCVKCMPCREESKKPFNSFGRRWTILKATPMLSAILGLHTGSQAFEPDGRWIPGLYPTVLVNVGRRPGYISGLVAIALKSLRVLDGDRSRTEDDAQPTTRGLPVLSSHDNQIRGFVPENRRSKTAPRNSDCERVNLAWSEAYIALAPCRFN